MPLDQLLEECFWEYDYTPEDIIHMSKGEMRSRRFLFEKILMNSTNLLQDLEIFDRETLKQLLDQYVVPGFNADFLFRRKNIIENYFFDQPVEIEELKWSA